MTSPFLQPAWTIEEAILLVEASENVASGRVEEENVIKQLSERLRSGAKSLGLTISLRYRSEDDVRNNLKLMSSMLKMAVFFDEDYFQGSTLGAVALYYHKQKDRYNQLLEHANDLYPLVSDNEITTADDSLQEGEFDMELSSGIQESDRENEMQNNSAQVEMTSCGYNEHIETHSGDETLPDIRIEDQDKEGSIISGQVNESATSEGNENIDAANEGLASYPAAQRKRPRVSGKKIGTYKSEISFKSVFPNFSSNLNTINLGKEASHIERPYSPISQQGENRNSIHEKLSNIKQVLIKSFPRGYRLGSPLDLKRFRAFYMSQFEKSVAAADEVLEGYIKNIGFEYNGKIYVSDAVLSTEYRDKICGFIIDILSTERDFVFLEHIFNHFKDEIDYTIVDSEMLRLYLKGLNKSKWYIREKYIASSSDVMVSIKQEVISFIKDSGNVVKLNEVKESLEHLPLEEVEHEWNFNGDVLISNSRNEKFHIDTFFCPPNTLARVSELIYSALERSAFMTGEELLQDIRINLPELFANNDHISELGFRNALGKLLANKFSFRNNIISKLKDSYDGPDAVLAFCKNKGYFTFDEIEEISKLIGCSPNYYLEKIYQNSIRIDEAHFVPRNQVQFNVNEIDKVLELFNIDLYTPVTDIITFDAFPSCGEYTWNIWMLENYLLTSSKKFSLVHPRLLSKETVTGAIVRKDGIIKTYDDLIIQAIANSDIAVEEDEAMEYLYDRGLINVRRKNGQVKKLLIKSREYRNRIRKNKN